MLQISSTKTSGIGTVVKCVNCNHVKYDVVDQRVYPEVIWEWTDTDGTVFYEGNTPESLLAFMVVHIQ